MPKLCVRALNRHQRQPLIGGAEISGWASNFGTPLNQKKLGPRCWQRPKWALPTPRPWILTHLHSLKKMGHPKHFLRKKLFSMKSVPKLGDLTVITYLILVGWFSMAPLVPLRECPGSYRLHVLYRLSCCINHECKLVGLAVLYLFTLYFFLAILCF